MAFLLQYSNMIFSLLAGCLSIYLYYKFRVQKSTLPPNLPLLGMTLSTLWNYHRFNDYISDILKRNNGTFMYKGVWFAGQDMLFTSDPSNFRYISSTKFHNFIKDQEFRDIFDIFGDGILNYDTELWELHRKITMSFLKDGDFLKLVEINTWNNIEKKLTPVLEHMSERGSEIDLQIIFQRLTFDSSLKLVCNYDPKTLSVGLLPNVFEEAFTKSEEALLARHFLPKWLWMFLNRHQIGNEKHLNNAAKLSDEIIYKLMREISQEKQTDDSIDSMLITGFMREYRDKSGSFGNPDKFVKDNLLNLIVAGRDTTSSALTWFFYLLSKNPVAEYEIYNEIKAQLGLKDGDKWKSFGSKELKRLCYLHGALCETLRLFPPIPLNSRITKEADTLPSGIRVNKGIKVMLPLYAMGRSETIWGQDSLEFKPERWLSTQGDIKHVPSYKFSMFHAGPKSCLGKDISFLQMKIVAASIIYNYKIEVRQGLKDTQNAAIVLQLKYGLMVKLTKRK